MDASGSMQADMKLAQSAAIKFLNTCWGPLAPSRAASTSTCTAGTGSTPLSSVVISSSTLG